MIKIIKDEMNSDNDGNGLELPSSKTELLAMSLREFDRSIVKCDQVKFLHHLVRVRRVVHKNSIERDFRKRSQARSNQR